MRISLVVFGVLAFCPAAYGQLYLMTSTPSPDDTRKFASALFRVFEDGALRSIAEIVPATVGTDWISVSYDARTAVLLAGRPDHPIVVVDFDQAAVVKTCKLPPLSGRTLVEQWLADVPVHGHVFEWHAARIDLKDAIVQSMTLDAAVPCADSFGVAAPADIRFAVAHGTAGVAGIVPGDGFHIAIDQEGKLVTVIAGEPVYFDEVPLSAELRKEATYSELVVNNSKISVIQTVNSQQENPRSTVFRKSDRSWHVIPVPGYQYEPLRALGKFVAIVEHQAKRATLAQKGRSTFVIGDAIRDGEPSAGGHEWRKEDTAAGYNMHEVFSDSPSFYPGRLYLYDSDTERLDMIETKQGDSEIILVENNILYYRVSDRLYSAPITDRGIGAAQLLATAEAIRDAHWAFIKH